MITCDVHTSILILVSNFSASLYIMSISDSSILSGATVVKWPPRSQILKCSNKLFSNDLSVRPSVCTSAHTYGRSYIRTDTRTINNIYTTRLTSVRPYGRTLVSLDPASGVIFWFTQQVAYFLTFHTFCTDPLYDLRSFWNPVLSINEG